MKIKSNQNVITQMDCLNLLRTACEKKCEDSISEFSVEEACTDQKFLCEDCDACKAFYGKRILCLRRLSLLFQEIILICTILTIQRYDNTFFVKKNIVNL